MWSLFIAVDTIHCHIRTEEPDYGFKTQTVSLHSITILPPNDIIDYKTLLIHFTSQSPLFRPILLNNNGKKPKYIHEIYDEPPLEHNKVCVEV